METLRQIFGILNLRCPVRRDQEQRSERTLIQVWGLALDHLNGHDTQRPNIDLAAVFLARYDFGRHPVGCANHGCAFSVGLVDLSAESEVGWGDVLVL